ncbi:reverse transcriptase [Gossypium australe]|uniref:Reverse transcriptase n=1 Tax=Gossypium australe TaxID=47621 RepID=A0A5B6VIC5_9ROSI|nr:reverse transcriptase [Gossypium australe]
MIGYDFSIAYKKGTQNTMVDALPRRPHPYTQDPQVQKLCQELQSHPQDGILLQRKGKPVVGSNTTLRRTLFDLFQGGAIGGHSGTQMFEDGLENVKSAKVVNEILQLILDYYSSYPFLQRLGQT